jgi:hypothetical protein
MPNEQWNEFARDVKERLDALQEYLDVQLIPLKSQQEALTGKIREIIDYLEAIKPHETVVMQNIQEDMEEEGVPAEDQADDFRGVGGIFVHDVPGGKVIGYAGEHEAGGALSSKQMRFGKLKTAWSSGNSVTLNPCENIDGDNPDTSRDITCYIRLPTDAIAPEAFDADQGDVLAYYPITDTTGVLVGSAGHELPAGGTATTNWLKKAAGGDFQVDWATRNHAILNTSWHSDVVAPGTAHTLNRILVDNGSNWVILEPGDSYHMLQHQGGSLLWDEVHATADP